MLRVCGEIKSLEEKSLPPGRDRREMGAQVVADAQAKEIMTFFTSVAIQRHEWGHQSDLKQPAKAQRIFNLAVVACFGGIVFPWLQKWAVFTHFTTTSPGRESKRAPF